MATPVTVQLTCGEAALVRYAMARLRDNGVEYPDPQAALLDSADENLA